MEQSTITLIIIDLLIMVAVTVEIEPQEAVGQAYEVFSRRKCGTFGQEMEGGSPFEANPTAAPTLPPGSNNRKTENNTTFIPKKKQGNSQNQNTTTGGSISPTGQTGAQNQTQMVLGEFDSCRHGTGHKCVELNTGFVIRKRTRARTPTRFTQ